MYYSMFTTLYSHYSVIQGLTEFTTSKSIKVYSSIQMLHLNCINLKARDAFNYEI